jgi:hypothetical protein
METMCVHEKSQCHVKVTESVQQFSHSLLVNDLFMLLLLLMVRVVVCTDGSAVNKK